MGCRGSANVEMISHSQKKPDRQPLVAGRFGFGAGWGED
jgi:hypothetical protein